MTRLKRTFAIFGLLLVACGILFACACEFAPAQNVEGQIIAAQYGEFKVPGEKTGTFLFPSDVCQVSGGGKNFSAFATGRAVKIVDSDPNKTEIATPSSVFISQCTVNMSTTFTHVPPYYLTSGTGGLQEAITANQTNNGINSIILNWEWYAEIQPRSAATVIGSVTGITSLGLVDITVTPYQYYRWNGSQYVAIPTNGSVASVGLTAPSSVFGVTNSPITVSGNLGLTLNSQAQNTALRGPSSGSGIPTFRTDTAADVAQAGALYNAIASANINGMMYPAQCGSANPPSWCSGTTADAWYRAACTQLPSAGGFINLLGLTGTIAASATCSTPTKQVITLEDPTSLLTITESDGGIAFPLDNGSMLLGPGAGQCNQSVGGTGIRLSGSANVTAIVGPAHTDGTQEDLTASGLCLEGATGATVTKGLLYTKKTFVNTTFDYNNVAVCNNACLWLDSPGGIVHVEGNEFNVSDGDLSITGSAIVVASTGGPGCEANSIDIGGGNAEHAVGGASFPEINIFGNGSGAEACSVHIHDIYTERTVGGTPSTVGIKVQDCFGCSFTNISAGGGTPASGDLINISASAPNRVQNVTFFNVNNILGSWTNTINDTTIGCSAPCILPAAIYPYIDTYTSNPGYQQPAVLPGTTLQSVSGDVMGGAGNFATGSGTFGTNFQASGCIGTVTCTYTRTNSTAPPGFTYSQQVQITANTDSVTGDNGIQYTPTVSFTAGQTYTATFWAKGDGAFTGIPNFLLWSPILGNTYCSSLGSASLTTTWTLYSFSCTPASSGSSFLSASAFTPPGATGTFWIGDFVFAPVVPLVPGNLVTSVTPYGIGPATTAQQTITLGTTALLLGQTVNSIAGLTSVTTGSISATTGSIAGLAAGAVTVSGIATVGQLAMSGGRKGTFICTAGGTIPITNANETATSDVIISLNTAGGTITTPPAMKTVTAGTGFTVLCGASDTSTYGYDILN